MMEIARPFSLQGRTAVVTGAGSGIGRQAALTFAEAGASLVILDRDAAGLEECAAELRLRGGGVETAIVDVADREAIEAVAARVTARTPIDVWANVAGVLSTGLVTDVSPEELERVLSINLKGTFHGCAAAARAMTGAGRGSIINISSAAVDWPGPGYAAYAMTKAAINSLTRTLAHEVGPAGVRVNAVAPGFIDTPMVVQRFVGQAGTMDADGAAAFVALRASQTVLGRIGTPEDIALAMLYLASEASGFMTGQILRPNGGIAMP